MDSEEILAEPVGLLIRALRQEAGWKQWELADRVGVDPNAVSAWERGERLPNRSNRPLLWKALELDQPKFLEIFPRILKSLSGPGTDVVREPETAYDDLEADISAVLDKAPEWGKGDVAALWAMAERNDLYSRQLAAHAEDLRATALRLAEVLSRKGGP